jgi:hypothetical protein
MKRKKGEGGGRGKKELMKQVGSGPLIAKQSVWHANGLSMHKLVTS